MSVSSLLGDSDLGGSGVVIFMFRPTQIEGLPSACQTFQDASKALPDGENLNKKNFKELFGMARSPLLDASEVLLAASEAPHRER